jgi:DNA-binding SARP family transcriptional activator
MSSFYKIIFFVLIICNFTSGTAQNIYNRGLYFRSFEVDQDKRTGLNLTPERKLDVPNGFSLKFDIKLRKMDQTFGYVFRIIGGDSVNLDLISDISSNDNIFSLVSGMKSLIQVCRSDFKNFKVGEWAQLSLDYNPHDKLITLKINELVKRVNFTSEKMKSIELCFGRNKHKSFSTTDLPPMTIRDIFIYNEKNKLIRNWKLEKHATDKVYDECEYDKATCTNPVWEIDKHVKWQHKAHFVLPYLHPQICFDEVNERLFIVKKKTVLIYNAGKETFDTIQAKRGEAYNCQTNQLVYNSSTQELVSYSFDNSNLAKFDFQSAEWTNQNSQVILSKFWHHGKYLDTNDNSIITVGGYGYHKYKGCLMKYSFKDKGWKQHDISSQISPRYLGSLGALGKDELLYFGGYGSKTGNQEEFPQNYYDLYKINPKTFEIKKLWQMEAPNDHFTNGNSLVVNKEKGVFYNLAYSNTRYSTALKLMEFSIDKPEFKFLGDSIQYKFKDVESYCDLFYCSKSAQLLAVTSVSKKNSSEIRIYSIAYPPLQAKDVLQKDALSFSKWYFLFLLLLIIPLFVIFRKRKATANSIILNSTEVVSNYEYNVPEIEFKPSSLSLLGCFQIVDSEGVNVTGSFTPTISQLLVLIILHTVKNGQGISSQELTDILWYDKDADSARNNRNVNFSKLRLLVKKVGDLELINKNSYWSIQIGQDVSCDYKNVNHLIDLIKKQAEINMDLVLEFVNLVSRGALLPNFQDEWLDSFKGEYTNTVIETLTLLSKNADIIANLGLLFRISDAILLHDNIDEDAARLKVYALYNMGKKGQAIQYFEKFTEDYKSLMGASFSESFDQFRVLKRFV